MPQKQLIGDTAKSAVRTALAKAKQPGTLVGLKMTDVKIALTDLKPLIAEALPNWLTPDRMLQIAVTIITKNQRLAECSIPSIVGAVMESSILGLEPNTAKGEAYIIPYSGHAQFQIGYKGYIKLAWKSSELKSIYAYNVFQGDMFDYGLGDSPFLNHKPAINSSAPTWNDLIGSYAVAHFINGGKVFEWVKRAEIDEYRRRSPGQGAERKDMWAKDWKAMAKKTAVRRLSPWLPSSDDNPLISRAFIADERVLTPDMFRTGNEAERTGIDDTMLEPIEIEPGDYSVRVVDEKPKPVDGKSKPVDDKPPTPEEILADAEKLNIQEKENEKI